MPDGIETPTRGSCLLRSKELDATAEIERELFVSAGDSDAEIEEELFVSSPFPSATRRALTGSSANQSHGSANCTRDDRADCHGDWSTNSARWRSTFGDAGSADFKVNAAAAAQRSAGAAEGLN
jgi:hypothetical protein